MRGGEGMEEGESRLAHTYYGWHRPGQEMAEGKSRGRQGLGGIRQKGETTGCLCHVVSDIAHTGGGDAQVLRMALVGWSNPDKSGP